MSSRNNPCPSGVLANDVVVPGVEGQPGGVVLTTMSKGFVLIRLECGRRQPVHSSRLIWSSKARGWKCHPKDAVVADGVMDVPIVASSDPQLGHMVILSDGIVETFGWIKDVREAEGAQVFILSTYSGEQAVLRSWIEPGAFEGAWVIKAFNSPVLALNDVETVSG